MNYRKPESETEGICLGCGNLKSLAYMSKTRWVCINLKCIYYFEPALQQPIRGEAKVRVEGAGICAACKARLEKTSHDAVWACRWCNPKWFAPPLPPLSNMDQWMADILAKNFKTDGPDGVALNSIPHPGAGDNALVHDACGTIQIWDDEASAYHCPKCHPVAGIKLDAEKPPIYTEFLMQFPLSIRMIALVGDAGSKAVGHVRSGWKEVDRGHERYSNALGRHLLEEAQLAGDSACESPDPVRDLIWQAATVAWNDLARLEHLIRTNQAAAERLDTTREV